MTVKTSTLTPEMKDHIDKMDYVSMLRAWRFSPSGDPLFQGEVGEYFQKIMIEKRDALHPGEHTAASKLIGWG
jgi:hypothetical protein